MGRHRTKNTESGLYRIVMAVPSRDPSRRGVSNTAVSAISLRRLNEEKIINW